MNIHQSSIAVGTSLAVNGTNCRCIDRLERSLAVWLEIVNEVWVFEICSNKKWTVSDCHRARWLMTWKILRKKLKVKVLCAFEIHTCRFNVKCDRNRLTLNRVVAPRRGFVLSFRECPQLRSGLWLSQSDVLFFIYIRTSFDVVVCSKFRGTASGGEKCVGMCNKL